MTKKNENATEVFNIWKKHYPVSLSEESQKTYEDRSLIKFLGQRMSKEQPY